MRNLTSSFLLLLLCCLLPTLSSAATTQTIHAEWNSYSPPSGMTVTGFRLYQDGTFACMTESPTATSMDCQVTLAGDSATFTLTATFSNGSESPHSAPVTYTVSTPAEPATGSTDPTTPTTPETTPTAPETSDTTTPPTSTTAPTQPTTGDTSSTTSPASTTSQSVHAEWNSYAPPSGLIVSGFKLYKDGTVACQVEGASATSLDCQVTLENSTANFTLTAFFTDGTESPHSAPVAFAAGGTTLPGSPPAGGTTATPPTAVIASSAAAGAAPLQVSFNGSGSTAANGATIVNYAWSFGDGTAATGATAAHSFTAAGTYATTLTVTDSQGQTNSTNTPIVVTAPITTTNKTPLAVATATPTSGTAPLTVNFDASGSSDSDGSIASYLWTFGDGSTATGKTTSHTYTAPADFVATLKVTDNLGTTGTTSITIKAASPAALAGLNIEAGEINVGSTWVRVPIAGTFNTPVVVTGPPGSNNAEPCVIRLRNITPTGFEIRLEEWNYLSDRSHPAETVSYLIMEKGRTTLPNGSIVEAGSFAGGPTNQMIRFSAPFNKPPVIMTTVTSANELDTISGRLSKITTTTFTYMFREQERNKNYHLKETVNYIAWEPGQGAVGTLQYEVANAPNGLTDQWSPITFQKAFEQPPVFLAHMQTTNNTDTSSLRARSVAATGVPLKIEEEQSKDVETSHPAETVGYMVFDKAGEEASVSIWPSDAVPSTVDAGSDGPQELGVKFRSDVNGYVTGIRFYKAATNTGTHVANLWTSTGTLLATATFTNETESGWPVKAQRTPVKPPFFEKLRNSMAHSRPPGIS